MTIEGLSKTLRAHGCRVTPQRRAMIQVIAARRGLVTAGNVYDMVNQECPGIGIVTVYRMLDLMDELGLVCRLHGHDRCRTYLVGGPEEHHHHLVCSNCGKVVNFTECSMGALEQRLTRESGFTIRGHLLEFEGLCQHCSQISDTHASSAGEHS